MRGAPIKSSYFGIFSLVRPDRRPGRTHCARYIISCGPKERGPDARGPKEPAPRGLGLRELGPGAHGRTEPGPDAHGPREPGPGARGQTEPGLGVGLMPFQQRPAIPARQQQRSRIWTYSSSSPLALFRWGYECLRPALRANINWLLFRCIAAIGRRGCTRYSWKSASECRRGHVARAQLRMACDEAKVSGL